MLCEMDITTKEIPPIPRYSNPMTMEMTMEMTMVVVVVLLLSIAI